MSQIVRNRLGPPSDICDGASHPAPALVLVSCDAHDAGDNVDVPRSRAGERSPLLAVVTELSVIDADANRWCERYGRAMR